MIVHHCQKLEAFWVKILLLGTIIASTNAHALVDCFYVSQFDENEIKKELASIQSQCDAMDGGGGKFYASYSKVPKCIASNTAELVDSSFGVWQLVFGCNTCEAKEVVVEVEDFKNACAEKCMLTDYQCVWQNGEWGGSLGAFPKVCSKIDSTATGAKKMRNEE